MGRWKMRTGAKPASWRTTGVKRCARCKDIKPANKLHFRQDNSGTKASLSSYCIPCLKEYRELLYIQKHGHPKPKRVERPIRKLKGGDTRTCSLCAAELPNDTAHFAVDRHDFSRTDCKPCNRIMRTILGHGTGKYAKLSIESQVIVDLWRRFDELDALGEAVLYRLLTRRYRVVEGYILSDVALSIAGKVDELPDHDEYEDEE